MLKKSKKFLSIIMVVIMVLTAVPLSAFVGIELPVFDLGIRASAKAVASSGKCGPNVTYTYNSSTGELVIKGTGSMTDYVGYDASPFYSSNIKSVVVGDGVTTIGDCAFNDCDNLTSVTIGDSITTIGDNAFYHCSYLTSISIGGSVTTIGKYAFAYCDSLTSISISDNITTIGECAFFDCDGLINISIGDSVTTVDTASFAFCRNLTSVIIGDGVTKICGSAFDNCYSLTDVYYNGTEEQWNSIVIGSDNDKLLDTTIHYTNPVVETGKCGDNATYTLYADGSLIISGSGKIDDAAFIGRDDIISVTIESGVTSLDYNAFRRCESLSEVHLDKSLRYIGSYAFDDCSDLNTVYYNGTEKDFYRLVEASPRSYLYTVNGMRNPEVIFAHSGETSDFKEKDKFAYGSYPQTKITDETLLETLDSLEAEFVGAFAEVEYLGEKYRAVSADKTISWYKYEPIIWRVINPDTGMVLSENILDKRAYTDTDEWLDNFYNVAFNEEQKMNIATVARVRESFSDQPAYDYSGYDELDITSGFAFAGFGTKATDYANLSNKKWWLRTGVSGTSGKAYYMSNDTFIKSQPADESSVFGLRPAMCLELENIACEHFYSQIITAPTCKEKGYTTYICECGDRYVDNYTDELNHRYTSEITRPATHTSEGVRTFTCECDDSYTEVIPKLTEHTYTSSVTTEPTHLKEGIRTYICECNDTYTEAIPKLTEHTYTHAVTPPTCTEQGYTTYICECGDTYKDDYVDELGHSFTNYISDGKATCVTDGSLVAKCDNCDKLDSIPEKGDHKFSNSFTIDIDPTCTNEGQKSRHCINCSEKTDVTPIGKLAHKYSSVVTNPTCTAKGYTTFTCECGDTYKADYVNENGHKYKSEITTPATHLTDGVETFNCHCGDSYTKSVPKTEEHKYNSLVTDPTCAAKGYTTFTCECGDSYVSDYVDMLPHTYNITTIVPDCTNKGYKVYTCACGDNYADTIPANGHTESEWIIDANSTCVNKGSKHIECTVCEETIKTQLIEKLPHNYKTVVTAPTCEESGYTTYTCECGYTYTGDSVSATGHSYSNGICSGCGDDKTADCSCNCHKSGISKIIFKIVSIKTN